MIVEVVMLIGTVSVAVAATKFGRGGPLVVSTWVLCGSLLILVFAPLGFVPVSFGAGAIVGIGILSLVAPMFFFRSPRRAVEVDQGHRRVAFARLVFSATIVVAMVAIGYREFENSIAAVTGQSFDQLSIVQIRTAQIGESHGGGLLALAGSTGAVLACLGLYGALRYSRWWLVLPAAAAWVALRSPARLDLLSLMVVMTVFYLYARRSFGGGLEQKRLSRRSQLVVVLVAGTGAVSLFNSIGSQLGKNQSAANLFPQFNWPSWMLSPFVYFSGGFPALSQALKLDVNPFDDGGSYFSLVRLASVFFPSIRVPRTIGGYVGIPDPINIYTGFGGIDFQFGVLGVVFFLALLGWFATIAHLRAMQGRIEWAWVSAVIASVLFALPQGYHLFNLDVDFRLAVGFWVFWFIRHAKSTGGARFPSDLTADSLV